MKVLFAGGGTAGHVTPALSIAEIIRNKYPAAVCIFAGRSGGDENRAILSEGYKLYTLDVEGVRRSLSPKNIKVIIKLLRSIQNAKKLIKSTKPDLIIGTGGYVSLPVLISGVRLGVPTLMHESNAYPGLVTRKFGKKCDAVMLGMEEAKEHLNYRDNLVTVGNPTRSKFAVIGKEDARRGLGIKKGELLIVSFGGSGGAERLNDVIIDVMKEHSAKNNMIRHIHATGRRSYPVIEEYAPELCRGQNGAKLVPYIENMPELLSAADISITRSGAMTLAELEQVECAPILIPSPNVAANHQYKNAEALAKRGGAILIEEKELTEELLVSKLKMLESDPKARHNIRIAKQTAGHGECGKKILGVIEDVLSSAK